MYPIDSIQSVIIPSPWWKDSRGNELKRGSLIYAFVPHIDQVPMTLTPKGRKTAEQHDKAIFDIAPLRIKNPRSGEDLPVAALSLHQGELWTAYRSKKRPCLVLANKQPMVDDKLRRDMPRKTTSPTIIVAPYYGVDKNGKRAGYNSKLLERIRHAEYPQFLLGRVDRFLQANRS